MKFFRFTALILMVSALWATAIPAATIPEMVKELQQMKFEDGEMTLAWWIPADYWKVSFEQTPNMDPNVTAEILEMVSGYTIIAVASGQVGATGIKMEGDRELAEKTTLHIGRTHLSPLADSEISDDLRMILGVLRPVMAELLGQFGDGLSFLAFEADKESTVLDPRAKGRFMVDIGGKRFYWRLPLGYPLPAKIDADTFEEFPGNYNFNPFTGTQLTLKEASGDSP